MDLLASCFFENSVFVFVSFLGGHLGPSNGQTVASPSSVVPLNRGFPKSVQLENCGYVLSICSIFVFLHVEPDDSQYIRSTKKGSPPC